MFNKFLIAGIMFIGIANAAYGMQANEKNSSDTQSQARLDVVGRFEALEKEISQLPVDMDFKTRREIIDRMVDVARDAHRLGLVAIRQAADMRASELLLPLDLGSDVDETDDADEQASPAPSEDELS